MYRPGLRRIDLSDIQLVRYWRNLDHVRLRMVHTGIIEKDDQKKWFMEMDFSSNYYFIYSLDFKDIGIVSITKINHEDRSFECGIFCGDELYLKHWINLWACLKIYSFAFDQLSLDTSYATILKNNDSALRLNKAIGYVFIEDQDENVGRFILTRENYLINSKSINKYINYFLNE
jgi:RimJ/RimL family protein N-acetyltransferase